MVRNKEKNFPGPRKIEEPKAKSELAALRPDGTIAPQPRDRMRESGKES
ncbi:small acid-soluble spore protein K [Effusibacillus pohliae]|nr:small acid-soluble spore protein K [Effusibacillus pohliae]